MGIGEDANVDQGMAINYTREMAVTLFSKKTIDSTNECAKRLLKKNPELLIDGFVVISDIQTKGKGTKGRVWYSRSNGGLYYSLALVPKTFDFASIEYYHQAIAENIQSVIHTLTNITLTIKYPNDLYLSEKKMGGILMESAMKVSENPVLDYLIIGIGLNINQSSFPTDLSNTTTSLFIETNHTYPKRKIVKPLTKKLLTIFS